MENNSCKPEHFINLLTPVITQFEPKHVQLVRGLQGQDGDVVGEEFPATPKNIFQMLNQVYTCRAIYVCSSKIGSNFSNFISHDLFN